MISKSISSDYMTLPMVAVGAYKNVCVYIMDACVFISLFAVCVCVLAIRSVKPFNRQNCDVSI